MAGNAIQDRWVRTDPQTGDEVKSERWGIGKRYRARYRDLTARQHSKTFSGKREAQAWLTTQTAALRRGDHIAPSAQRTTVAHWCDLWLSTYTAGESTRKQAGVHIKVIKAATFAGWPIGTVKPSDVRGWVRDLSQRYAASTTYALHRTLSRIMTDAVHDGVLAKSPCSRRTSPAQPSQRPYVASTEQVWGLHDAMPENLRPAILLGAFAGLRVGEVAGLRVGDVDWLRGVITPEVQYPCKPLKTDTSRTALPIPASLRDRLAETVETDTASPVVRDLWGHQCAPWTIERAVRECRDDVPGLPKGFRFHDLRHYHASLLIAQGLDVKKVQVRMRHASAVTTLNIYGHLMPDDDDSTRDAVASAWRALP